MVEIEYKGKTYVGLIKTMYGQLKCEKNILDYVQYDFDYEITLIPYDFGLRELRENEKITIVINDLSKIKWYDNKKEVFV